mgnify:CR=1 FL=1
MRAPTHPGALLREEVIPAMGISISEFARKIGVSRQMLHRILAESHGITTEMSLRIGKFVGNGPGIWLRMQQAYDLWFMKNELASELEEIQQHPVA